MPELPEVETVRRGLEPKLKGRAVAAVSVARRDLREKVEKGFEAALAGRKFLGAERRAKYLLLRLSGGKTLIVHLGMSGRLVLGEKRARAKHDHVVLLLDNGQELAFSDPRRFGLMKLVENASVGGMFKNLGPEPFSEEFNAGYVIKAFAGRKIAVKLALMDQKIVVGVGNIYASEALFRSGVSPFRPAGEISAKEAAKIVSAVRAVLSEAIESGGSTLRDYVRSSGESGYFQHNFAVYGKSGSSCPKCGAKIKSARQGGRATYYCGKCQGYG